MIKIIIYLLIVTQICCLAQEDNKKYKEDEIDITTSKSGEKDSPKVDDKSVSEYDNKEVPQDDNNKEEIPKNPEEKVPDSYETDIKNEKPVNDKPGFDPKDEEITKKVDKPLHSEPDIDLGKGFKKVVVKDKDNEKDTEKDNPNTVYDSNKGYGYGKEEKEEKKPDQGIAGEGEYGSDKDNGYPFKPPGSPHKNGKEIEIANEIIDNLMKLIKTDYRSDFEQVKLDDLKPFDHGRWGSVVLHSGVVTGLTNIERTGNVVVIDEYNDKKLIIGDIGVKDVLAEYKMNAKLFHRITFKDRDLKLIVKKALLNIKLEVDKTQKKFIVKELNLKSFEGFGVKSGRLFWPFNKLTNAIVKNQEQVIKDLIKKEFTKYMGKVVENIQFDEIFGKLF